MLNPSGCGGPRQPLAPAARFAASALLALVMGAPVRSQEPLSAAPKVGESLTRLKALHADARLVRFSADGRWLAVSVRSANAVYLYQTTDWTLVRILRGHRASCCRMYAISFSPDSQTVAAAGMDDTLRLFGVATGEESFTLAVNKPVTAVVFAPDGASLATASEEGVSVWDAHTGQRLKLVTPDKDIDALSYAPDGRLLATGGRSVRIWSTTDWQQLSTMPAHTPVTSLEFSPDGASLAESEEREVNLWSSTDWKLQKSFKDPDSSSARASAYAARVLMGPAWLILGAAADEAAITSQPVMLVPTTRSLAMVRDPRTGGRRSHDVLVYDGSKDSAHLLQLGHVLSLSFTADGSLVAAATDGTVKVWDAASGQQRQ
jgi:hypothetical protein